MGLFDQGYGRLVGLVRYNQERIFVPIYMIANSKDL